MGAQKGVVIKTMQRKQLIVKKTAKRKSEQASTPIDNRASNSITILSLISPFFFTRLKLRHHTRSDMDGSRKENGDIINGAVNLILIMILLPLVFNYCSIFISEKLVRNLGSKCQFFFLWYVLIIYIYIRVYMALSYTSLGVGCHQTFSPFICLNDLWGEVSFGNMDLFDFVNTKLNTYYFAFLLKLLFWV